MDSPVYLIAHPEIKGNWGMQPPSARCVHWNMQSYSFLQDNGDGGIGDDGDQLMVNLLQHGQGCQKKAKTTTIPLVTQHIPTMTRSHHGGEMTVMMKGGIMSVTKSHHT